MAGATVSTAETLELDDMQGLILRGYGLLPEACLLLYRVGRPAAARAWLAGLVPQLTTAASAPATSAVNVALTVPGMAALGLPGEVADSFPLEVREGMVTEHRQRVLGDVDESAPEHWEFGGPGTPEPHLLLLVYTADAAALAGLVGELAGAAARGGLEELRRLETSNIGRAEHFGFRDGISQPRIAGVGKAPPSDDQVVRAGELVLGYRDEYGLYADRPLVPAQHDPGSVLPPDVEGSGAHDLGRNGSYLVLRQLEQDVPAFWRFADRSAGEDRIRLAAKMVGRWPSGAPLVLAPDADDPDIERDRLNAFRYHRDDPLARSCPVASHIRRTNPRESLDPDPGSSGSLAVGKHHRIMRRGRSYGTRLTIDQALAGGDGRRRGLYFMCLNTNVARQFEFIQQTWANSSKFAGLYDEPDPLLAPSGSFSMPADPVRHRVTGVPRFVTVRGGAYFMLPSVRAVRYLSGLDSSATGG
jgi:Dyp-type peroxidase family